MENMTVARTVGATDDVTTTEEALMTAGNPGNSTSAIEIAALVDRQGTFVVPDDLDETTGAEGMVLTNTETSLVAKGPLDVII